MATTGSAPVAESQVLTPAFIAKNNDKLKAFLIIGNDGKQMFPISEKKLGELWTKGTDVKTQTAWLTHVQTKLTEELTKHGAPLTDLEKERIQELTTRIRALVPYDTTSYNPLVGLTGGGAPSGSSLGLNGLLERIVMKLNGIKHAILKAGGKIPKKLDDAAEAINGIKDCAEELAAANLTIAALRAQIESLGEIKDQGELATALAAILELLKKKDPAPVPRRRVQRGGADSPPVSNVKTLDDEFSEYLQQHGRTSSHILSEDVVKALELAIEEGRCKTGAPQDSTATGIEKMKAELAAKEKEHEAALETKENEHKAALETKETEHKAALEAKEEAIKALQTQFEEAAQAAAKKAEEAAAAAAAAAANNKTKSVTDLQTELAALQESLTAQTVAAEAAKAAVEAEKTALQEQLAATKAAAKAAEEAAAAQLREEIASLKDALATQTTNADTLLQSKLEEAKEACAAKTKEAENVMRDQTRDECEATRKAEEERARKETEDLHSRIVSLEARFRGETKDKDEMIDRLKRLLSGVTENRKAESRTGGNPALLIKPSNTPYISGDPGYRRAAPLPEVPSPEVSIRRNRHNKTGRKTRKTRK